MKSNGRGVRLTDYEQEFVVVAKFVISSNWARHVSFGEVLKM